MHLHLTRRPYRGPIIVAALAAGLAFGGQEGTVIDTSGKTAVMTGLDNPRGLAFSPDGALHVVEAGRGGSGPCRVL